MKNQIEKFAEWSIDGAQHLNGGRRVKCSKGNNGIGQEKRGEVDGPPPGLSVQVRQDFNDKSGNRHGVEVG